MVDQTVVRLVMNYNDVPRIVREMHHASGVSVEELSLDRIYIPLEQGFGDFIGGELFGDIAPRFRHFNTKTHGVYVGVAPAYLGLLFGWRIGEMILIEFTPADRRDLNMLVELAFWPAAYERTCLSLVRAMMRYGTVTVSNPTAAIAELIASDGIDGRDT